MTDEEAIRQLIARFSHLLDDRRFDDWSKTFTEDGVFGARNGRQEIFEGISRGELARNPELKRKHAVTNSVIKVSGETAEATSDLIMFDLIEGGGCATRFGRYYDHLVRRDGQWLFSQRRLIWADRPPE
jgi:hypothetical protein